MYQLYIYVVQIILLISLGFQVVASADKIYPVLAISNGVKAMAGQLPYQVALKKLRTDNAQYYTFCGASIIGDKKLISAAHCFFYKEPSKYNERVQTPRRMLDLDLLYAVAGTVKNTGHYHIDKDGSGEQWRHIQNICLPDCYNFPKDDISVAITSEPFVFSSYVSALPYATRHTDYGAIQCAASGYGRVSFSVRSECLLWANLTLIPKTRCSLLHRRNMDNYICTESAHNDVMVGDSGGPLVCRNTGDPNEGGSGVIVGVVSGARENSGTFFTRVSNYKKLIRSCC